MNILIATPDYHQQRGNTVTAKRISNELSRLGLSTNTVSSTGAQSSPHVLEADLIHGFHAFKFYQYKKKFLDSETPYIVTLTGTDLNSDLYNPDRRKDMLSSLNGARAIHVFSEEARETLERECPWLSAKIFVIPQGTTIFPVKETHSEKKDETFLFLLPAGIRKVKNIPFAINTLKTLRNQHPSIRLMIAGPVIEEEEASLVKRMIDENSDWAEYAGHLPHEKMGELYAKADILLNTSIHEGQSTAILEALASGVPVLVSGNEGNRSIVEHTKTGMVYTNRSEFLDYAGRLISDEALRSSLAESAKSWSGNRHRGNSEGEALLEMYKCALRQKGAGTMPKTP